MSSEKISIVVSFEISPIGSDEGLLAFTFGLVPLLTLQRGQVFRKGKNRAGFSFESAPEQYVQPPVGYHAFDVFGGCNEVEQCRQRNVRGERWVLVV